MSLGTTTARPQEPSTRTRVAVSVSTPDDFMLEYPILINRPIVLAEHGTRPCRPSEVMLGTLPAARRGPFVKEDGAVTIDQAGRLVR